MLHDLVEHHDRIAATLGHPDRGRRCSDRLAQNQPSLSFWLTPSKDVTGPFVKRRMVRLRPKSPQSGGLVTRRYTRAVPAEYDAIIVGGADSGLPAAAFLGGGGWRTRVLEGLGVRAGAAVSEHPWPGYTVSTLSYVLSLMPPEVIRELELHRHGLTLYPLAADYYVPFPDGSHLLLTKDATQARGEIAKFSKKDADIWPAFSGYLAKIAQLVRPLLLMTPRTSAPRPPPIYSSWRVSLGSSKASTCRARATSSR